VGDDKRQKFFRIKEKSSKRKRRKRGGKPNLLDVNGDGKLSERANGQRTMLRDRNKGNDLAEA